MQIVNGYFTPEEDIYETLPDGRLIQLAAKGVPIAEAEARRQGFIKDTQVGPSETKTPGPSAPYMTPPIGTLDTDATKTINIGTPKPPTRTPKP